MTPEDYKKEENEEMAKEILQEMVDETRQEELYAELKDTIEKAIEGALLEYVKQGGTVMNLDYLIPEHLNEGGYLLKFTADYADEFDVEFFAILTKAEHDLLIPALEQYEDEIFHCFGYNECIVFKNGKEALKHFCIEPITAQEYEFLESRFGCEYGTGKWFIESLMETLELY